MPPCEIRMPVYCTKHGWHEMVGIECYVTQNGKRMNDPMACGECLLEEGSILTFDENQNLIFE